MWVLPDRRQFLVTLLVLTACGSPSPLAGVQHGRVVVVSIDGLMPMVYPAPDAPHPASPPLRARAARGATGRAHAVMPTVTSRAHTTLVTGVPPGGHGIVSNKPLDLFGQNMDGWRWYAEDIAV